MSTGSELSNAINLVFDPHLHVAGEVVEGSVDLYFPKLRDDNIEEVHVKLRGFIATRITRQRGESSYTYRQRVDLCRENISLWRKGCDLYPPPGSHVLSLPFRFVLPSGLPPSCTYSGYRWQSTVGYLVQAVGERPILSFNRRVQKSFPVLPVDVRGAQLRSVLSAGWDGGWKPIEARNQIRKGIWGDYSQVEAILMFPDVEAYPVLTPIPFTLSVVTMTKTMKFDDHKEEETIFPEPSHDPKKYELKLEAKVWTKAKSQTNNGTSNTGVFGGLGDCNYPRFYENIQVEPVQKVWIPSPEHGEKAQKGRWKQEVLFRSSFLLRCAPSFSAETLRVEYRARLKIPFPGLGNDTKLEFPMRIISSMPAPGESWQGPPPELDLPPGYFDTGSWANLDEKDEKD